MTKLSNYQHVLKQKVQSQLDGLAPQQNLVILNPNYHRHFPSCLNAILAKGGFQIHVKTQDLPADPGLWARYMAQAFELSSPDLHHPTEVAAALAPRGPLYLLLEASTVKHSLALEEWLNDFCSALAPGQHVVLWGKQLPTRLLNLLSVERRALVPHLPEDFLLDYGQMQKQGQVLEVHTLGPTVTFINGRPIQNWEGQLPFSFFYFMVDRGMVTRNDIFETFWPALIRKEATNIFHVTKRKVNEILDHDLTLFGAGFYRLSDSIHLYYDVVMFQEAVQAADISHDPQQAIYLYEKALHLYRGPFLNGLDMDWAISRREELQQVYVDVLVNLAGLYEKDGRLAESFGLQKQAFSLLPYREDLTQHLLARALQNGQTRLAQEVYEKHKLHLAHLKLDPSEPILNLMKQFSAP